MPGTKRPEQRSFRKWFLVYPLYHLNNVMVQKLGQLSERALMEFIIFLLNINVLLLIIKLQTIKPYQLINLFVICILFLILVWGLSISLVHKKGFNILAIAFFMPSGIGTLLQIAL